MKRRRTCTAPSSEALLSGRTVRSARLFVMVGAVTGCGSREICCCSFFVGSMEPHPPVDDVSADAAREAVEPPVVDVQATARIWMERACPSQSQLCRLQFNRFRHQLQQGASRLGQRPEFCEAGHDGIIVDRRLSSTGEHSGRAAARARCLPTRHREKVDQRRICRGEGPLYLRWSHGKPTHAAPCVKACMSDMTADRSGPSTLIQASRDPSLQRMS